MLNIKIISVGKVKEDFIQKGIEEFKKRLSRFCKLEEVVIKESSVDNETALQKEEEGILNAINGVDYTIALAIKGEQLSSEELAKTFEDLMVNGTSSIALIIGSSHGLSENVYSKVNKKLSFSKMTFPHQLFKLLLLEQVYRAFMINEGGKYHK